MVRQCFMIKNIPVNANISLTFRVELRPVISRPIFCQEVNLHENYLSVST